MPVSVADAAPISVLVPTLNEERNLAACLKSIQWADEIIVFDSYSTDGTLKIAEAVGAQVVQRRFDDFATHKNRALDEIDFRHDWLFILERLEFNLDHIPRRRSSFHILLARRFRWPPRWRPRVPPWFGRRLCAARS